MVYYHQIIALYNASLDRLMQCVITSSLFLCPRFANNITPLPINSCYILRGTIECVLQYWFWFLPLEQINYGLHKLQLFFIGDIFSGAKSLPDFTSSCSVFHFFCGCSFGKCSRNHYFQNFCDIVQNCLKCFLLLPLSLFIYIPQLFYTILIKKWFGVSASKSSYSSLTCISGQILMIFSTYVNIFINWKSVRIVFLSYCTECLQLHALFFSKHHPCVQGCWIKVLHKHIFHDKFINLCWIYDEFANSTFESGPTITCNVFRSPSSVDKTT